MSRERLRLFASNLLERLTEPPPDGFPASLSAQSESSSRTPPATLLVTALVILCAIPRALMMWRIDAVCNDGYYYISIADLLDRGQFEDAFRYLNLNVYPAVLLILHKLGTDWVTGGQLWGVLISSLVVAPLFGWIRHAFNGKVAVVSCFLYIIHPELIEISAEPIREPMFWFFFNSCLYFSWRAVARAKWWMFIASGITFALASYTRSEGWLLLLPILLWPVLCRTGSWVVRFRLAAGTCLSLAMIPLLLVAVNVSLLRSHDRWEWGRFGNFLSSWDWLTTQVDVHTGPIPFHRGPVTQVSKDMRIRNTTGNTAIYPTRNETAAQIQPAAVLSHVTQLPAISLKQTDGLLFANAAVSVVTTIQAQPAKQTSETATTSSLWRIQAYLTDLVNSLELPACVLLLTGLFGWRRLLLRREYIVFILIGICVFAGVWVKLGMNGGINGRYFFTGWFVLVPFAALGFLSLAHRISQLQRPDFLARRGQTIVGVLVVVMTLASCGDAITSSHTGRQREASLGRWLNANYGPFDEVLVDNVSARTGYFAKGTIPEVCHDYRQFAHLMTKRQPSLIVLSKDFYEDGGYSYVRQFVYFKEVRRLPPSALPAHADSFVIFVRTQSLPDVTQAASEDERSRR